MRKPSEKTRTKISLHNFDHKKIVDNKTFWKTMTPFLQIKE